MIVASIFIVIGIWLAWDNSKKELPEKSLSLYFARLQLRFDSVIVLLIGIFLLIRAISKL